MVVTGFFVLCVCIMMYESIISVNIIVPLVTAVVFFPVSVGVLLLLFRFVLRCESDGFLRYGSHRTNTSQLCAE